VRKTRRRYASKDRRGQIVGRIGIEQRPTVVDKRKRFGDWESDTVQGKGLAALVTVVERKTGLLKMRKVSRATAELTATAMMSALKGWVVRTNTSDNGKEFAHHHKISEALSCKCYFARPYHSWERGTNENTNGLIRQYFPKGTAFEEVTDEQIQAVEDKLNNRPRKRHGFKSPLEVLKRCKYQVGVAIVS
jgi:IS30 family transposase